MEDNETRDYTLCRILLQIMDTAPDILPTNKWLYLWAKSNMKDKITGKDVGIIPYEAFRDWYARPALYAYIADLAIKEAKRAMPPKECLEKGYIEKHYGYYSLYE